MTNEVESVRKKAVMTYFENNSGTFLEDMGRAMSSRRNLLPPYSGYKNVTDSISPRNLRPIYRIA
jgi:hypothetical protein